MIPDLGAQTPILEPFPRPGPMVAAAYRDLAVAQYGTANEKRQLGSFETLPRPWDPSSCPPSLRAQVWAWLDDVATWVNRSYTWALKAGIPPCWPRHPHLAHELPVLADQRLHAGRALSSTPLEEWHRYTLPAFLDRLQTRLETGCTSAAGHDPWPAAPRHRRHTHPDQAAERAAVFAADTRPTARAVGDPDHTPPGPAGPPRLALVDLDSGELHDPQYLPENP